MFSKWISCIINFLNGIGVCYVIIWVLLSMGDGFLTPPDLNDHIEFAKIMFVWLGLGAYYNFKRYQKVMKNELWYGKADFYKTLFIPISICVLGLMFFIFIVFLGWL